MSSDLTEALEDYLEAIYDIILVKGGVRVKDIAGRLAVKNSSVTVALRNLRDSGFVNYEPYGVISLTDSGRTEARRISETHSVFRTFFVDILGVDEEDANETACRLEHAMKPAVMARFLEFMKFLSSTGQRGSTWKDMFEEFCIDNGVSARSLASPANYMDSAVSGHLS